MEAVNSEVGSMISLVEQKLLKTFSLFIQSSSLQLTTFSKFRELVKCLVEAVELANLKADFTDF